MATPAEILRAMLVEEGLAILPTLGGLLIPYVEVPDSSLVCFVASMADDYDKAICLYDKMGIMWGRSRSDYLEHQGIQMTGRHLNYREGSEMMQTIVDGIATMQNVTITVNGTEYTVDNVYRTTQIIPLGEEPKERRLEWSLGLRIAFG